AEHISSEAGRMQSHRDRLREIWLSHDDRHRRAADRVAKDHEAGWAPAIEGNGGFGNDRKGFARPTAKLRDRIGSDDPEWCLARACRLCSSLTKQQGGEQLRKLGKFDSGGGRLAGRDDLEVSGDLRVCGK